MWAEMKEKDIHFLSLFFMGKHRRNARGNHKDSRTMGLEIFSNSTGEEHMQAIAGSV